MACKENEISSKRLRLNWLITLLAGANTVATYSMAFSSMHNFMTNSKNELCGLAGLGESETMYAIASGIYNGGAIVGALIAPILLFIFKYRTVIAFGPVVQIFGSTLYGLSTNGWMVIAARFLLGASDALIITSVMSYYTASTRNQPNTRLKKRLMIAYSVVVSVSYVPFTGLILLVSQLFRSLDQFRWFSWFQVAQGFVLEMLVIFLFQSHDPDNSREHKTCCTRLNKQERRQSKSGGMTYNQVTWSCSTAIVVIYLLITGYVVDSGLTILDTLISPILSDYFGFSIGNTAYFFTGSLTIMPLASIIMLFLERIKISSRSVLILSLLIGTCGLISLGDWQSISENPCSNVSNVSTKPYNDHCVLNDCVPVSSNFNSNTTIYYLLLDSTDSCASCHYDNASTGEKIEEFKCNYQNMNYTYCLSTFELNSNSCKSIEDPELGSAINELYDKMFSSNKMMCESYDDCYWNKDSIITGDYCEDCLSICRSKSRSLSFVQWCIGVSLVLLATGIGRYILYPMMTKVSPPRHQPVTTSILVLIQALSRLVTPQWTVLLYIASGHRTFSSVAVMLLFQIPVYIGYCLFCSQLSTKRIDHVNTHGRPSFSSIAPLITKLDTNINTEEKRSCCDDAITGQGEGEGVVLPSSRVYYTHGRPSTSSVVPLITKLDTNINTEEKQSCCDDAITGQEEEDGAVLPSSCVNTHGRPSTSSIAPLITKLDTNINTEETKSYDDTIIGQKGEGVVMPSSHVHTNSRPSFSSVVAFIASLDMNTSTEETQSCFDDAITGQEEGEGVIFVPFPSEQESSDFIHDDDTSSVNTNCHLNYLLEQSVISFIFESSDSLDDEVYFETPI